MRSPESSLERHTGMMSLFEVQTKKVRKRMQELYQKCLSEKAHVEFLLDKYKIAGEKCN